MSLKTVDTNGKYWMRDMKNHIEDLRKTEIMVDGQLANKVLDIRVQPGGLEAAKSLIEFGKEKKVIVTIKQFGG